NGAGKSLLLRLLHGLLSPTSGEIFFGGAPLDDQVRAQQAMVFQRPVLLRRSVGANLDFVLRLRGEASASRRDSLLDQVGLLDKEKQPARLLSGGEQQRLALARVLALEPKVLFLDEPTASLDPASTLMIEEIARSVQRQGAMVVFVTHDLGQARRLADDIIFLHRGRLEEQSPAEPFFENPKSDAAKAFLEGQIVV
ncbi:MAG: ATP-binding cassette domain-containing protein, partial [Geminicoccaceae bacterium]